MASLDELEQMKSYLYIVKFSYICGDQLQIFMRLLDLNLTF